MSNYEKIEKIEKRKNKIWKKKMELHREIDRLNENKTHLYKDRQQRTENN